MYQTFNCPHCGAPGEVCYGNVSYSCPCRLYHRGTYGTAGGSVSICGCGTSTDGLGNKREWFCTQHAPKPVIASPQVDAP